MLDPLLRKSMSNRPVAAEMNTPDTISASNTTESHKNPFCALWLAKKRRNCKMRVKQGALYCAEHLTSNDESLLSSEDKRIPCPLDPAHSVYESRMKAHLKKCNARNPEITPSYFSKDLNSFGDEQCTEAQGIPICSTPSISDLVERIERISQDSPTNIPQRLRGVMAPLNEAEKHRLQQDALSQLILEKVDAEKYEKVVVIEFGAGKGGLSNFLWESFFMNNTSRLSPEFILIDRSNSRCKKDAKMKHEGATVRRIFLDIKDLNLGDLLSGYDRETTYFLWISKHLCGAATCLTLNSLLKVNNDGKCANSNVNGTFCVALCCHQCCSLQAYPNKAFLFESGLLKRGEEDEAKVFRMLCSITSWAVCGFRDRESEDESEEEREEDRKRVKLLENLNVQAIFSDEKKESIGRTMKRLLDHGRELKLKTFIPECELKHYVGEEITLENAVLIGHTASTLERKE